MFNYCVVCDRVEFNENGFWTFKDCNNDLKKISIKNNNLKKIKWKQVN
jgi:hypothetical protein